ncbi:phage major capsid protein [Frateuria terrea]|uniref:Phage major capsid protein, HK97 family n=1 Tax=Frateuria terrea TaxID=529704 RepID=A0A1H6UW68_9GAMM|nr:phage major capsid protein [Frateuria terrea]SEI92580.1 phage major capsid protein, HK97 family [Frateuria terrea]SFP35247.1 phage major capsid protein, HK97 family [Frateuria terrea]
MPKATRAEQILAQFKNPNAANGPQYHREVVCDPTILIDARAEIGKLGRGFDFNNEAWGNDRRSLLAKRTEVRKLHNELRESTQKLVRDAPADRWSAEHQATYDARMNAMSYLSSIANLIEQDLDLGDGNFTASAGAGPDLRDSDGHRVGKVLTNSVLRNEHSIAASLGVGPSEGISLADFVRGVANMRSTEAVRNTLSEGTSTSGGYTVPTVLLPGILSALTPASALIKAGAAVAVLDTEAKSFNIAGVDSIPTAAWRNESGNVAESDPAFRSITITPRSLAFRFKVSRELLADSPNLEPTLRTVIASAFAKELDRAGLLGTGTAPEIRGLRNITGVNLVSSGTNGAILTNYAKFINASRIIKEVNAPAPNAAIMSPREEETMALFEDTTGQPLRRPEALSGWSFYTSSQLPTDLTVGTSTDCAEVYVGDFSQFVYFMREGVSIQLATELYAETGEVGFICHTRVDVAAMYAQAFAVIQGVRPPA